MKGSTWRTTRASLHKMCLRWAFLVQGDSFMEVGILICKFNTTQAGNTKYSIISSYLVCKRKNSFWIREFPNWIRIGSGSLDLAWFLDSYVAWPRNDLIWNPFIVTDWLGVQRHNDTSPRQPHFRSIYPESFTDRESHHHGSQWHKHWQGEGFEVWRRFELCA